ncbi:hypothetical protein [Neorhizobium huautlense]|uniref:hypothetical protein n=1 Tax=Neorhizobium huautlense TaxID=67774 RepID=UPI000CF8AE62|nr:hypothetical protein [Neorhizobium huautlense]
MKRETTRLDEAQELLFNALAVMRLTERVAFEMSQTPMKSNDPSDLSALTRSIAVSSRLALEALQLVETEESEQRQGAV